MKKLRIGIATFLTFAVMQIPMTAYANTTANATFPEVDVQSVEIRNQSDFVSFIESSVPKIVKYSVESNAITSVEEISEEDFLTQQTMFQSENTRISHRIGCSVEDVCIATRHTGGWGFYEPGTWQGGIPEAYHMVTMGWTAEAWYHDENGASISLGGKMGPFTSVYLEDRSVPIYQVRIYDV